MTIAIKKCLDKISRNHVGTITQHKVVRFGILPRIVGSYEPTKCINML